MRLFSILAFLSFCCLLTMGVEGSYHDLPCIRDKLKEVPEISFLMDNIGAAPDVKARLDACDPSAPLTLFIPNNDAVVNAIKRFQSPESVGALDEMQKEFLGALAAYHITTGNSSTASLEKNGVSVLNTTMAIRPQFVALGEGIPQRLLVVAGAGENKTASVLLSMQKNQRYWNGTSKIILNEKFKGPNDAMIIKKDIQGKDGFIHVIDKVLIIPKNATEQLKISNLTVFASLITKAGASDWLNNLTAATIFAPTNKALRLLNDLLANKTVTNLASNINGYQSFYQKKVVFAEEEVDLVVEKQKPYQQLFDLPKNQLLNLIKAHVFKGVLYSTGFIENSVFTNYNNTDYTFQNLNKTAAGKIVPPPKPSKFRSVLSRFLAQHQDLSNNVHIANAIGNAPIAFANIFTRNGAIHVIDGVLGVNITALPKKKQNHLQQTPSPPIPIVVIPAPNVTQLPTMQSQSVGVACVNGTMIAKLANLTIKSNTTLESPAGPFQLIINAPIPDCPPSDQLCMVATLSNTCAIPPSPFQGLPTDLVTAKPSEVNVGYANLITFTPRCFNPQTHVCVNNHFLCPTTHPALCGDACYSPNQYRCFAKFSMCPTEAPNLCGEACYHEDKYQCHRGVLKEKEQAQKGGKGRK